MSHLQRRTTRVALTALVVGGISLGFPLLHAFAEPSDAAVCTEAGNVWVHVEIDDAVDGGCATDFATGLKALASAGFDVDASDAGFINTINGEPAVPGAEDWWAYAHSDEDLAGWDFYEVGATQSEPSAGSIEAWRLVHSWEAEDTFPSLTPEDLLADVEPSPEPSVTATPSPSASASVLPSVVPSTTPSQAPRPSLPSTGN